MTDGTRAAEAEAVLRGLESSARETARAVDQAFADAGASLARSLGRAAKDGEVSLAELARAVIAAANAGLGRRRGERLRPVRRRTRLGRDGSVRADVGLRRSERHDDQCVGSGRGRVVAASLRGPDRGGAGAGGRARLQARLRRTIVAVQTTTASAARTPETPAAAQSAGYGRSGYAAL